MAARSTDPEARRAKQQAKLDALHEKLTEQVGQLRSGDDWQRWLAFASRFHQYSFRNVMAIYAQQPDATLVAGYEAWRAMGRQVQRGEKGLQILAPVTRRVAPETPTGADRGGEETEATGTDAAGERALRVVGFRVTHVWDVSQTAGDPLPEPPTPELIRGNAPEGLWEAVTAQIQEAGFTVERGDTGRSEGYTDYLTRTVRVDENAEPAQAANVLAHELGHVLLHEPGQFGQPTTAGCRGVREVEAESIAYLITDHADLDTSNATFGYVTGWAADVNRDHPEQVVAATGQRVIATAHRIITRLDETPAATAAETTSERDHTPASAPSPTAAPTLDAHIHAGQTTAVSIGRRAAAEPPAPTPSRPARAAHEERLVAVCEAAADFHRDQLLHHPGAEPARRYLTSRGLGHVLREDSPWKIGYAPAPWRDLQKHLRGRGFSDQEISDAGLSVQARHGPIDRFRGRVVAPIRDADTATVAFIGRTVPDGSPVDGPKYLNSPATAIYDKSQVLYGLAEQRDALAAGARPVVVEGYLDVLAVAAPGEQPSHVAAVAACGTSLTPQHAATLDTATPAGTGTVSAYDSDRAGHEATLRAYDLLHLYDGPLDAAQLPAGTDPADMADHPDALRTLLSDPNHLQPLADVVIDDRLTPWEQLPVSLEASVGALRSVAPVLAEMSPEQVTARVPALAERLELDSTIVTTEITEALTDADTLATHLSTRSQRGDLPRPAEQIQEGPGSAYTNGAEPARLAGASFPPLNNPIAGQHQATHTYPNHVRDTQAADTERPRE